MSTPSFETFNETDVREEVIAPLLRQLGYRTGTDNNIIREQLLRLRYPQSSLGRKKPKSDPVLRGKADYILQVKGRLSWVIESKSPGDPIGTDEIEQAWTYASHPEVRAVYFALCNGHMFSVYRTIYTSEANPVLSLSFEKLETDFRQLANILGPEALLRDFQHIETDPGKPIGPGLRSIVRIVGGQFRNERSSLEQEILTELRYTIVQGAIERREDSRLQLFIEMSAPLQSLQEFIERLELSRMEMISESTSLSTDANQPTVFGYESTVVFPAGAEIPDLTTWKSILLPCNVSCHVRTTAQGTLQDRRFVGTFETEVQCQEKGSRASISGSFQAHLD